MREDDVLIIDIVVIRQYIKASYIFLESLRVLFYPFSQSPERKGYLKKCPV